MLEFLNNIILLPWNIFKVIWIYMFSIFVGDVEDMLGYFGEVVGG